MKPPFRLACAAALLVAAVAAHADGEPLDASPFDFRVPIAVSGYAGAAPLTNFPVLVALSADAPAGFRYSDCAADGSDLRFADADGNLLPHEVDTWNAAGESLVWVGLPVLTNGAAFTMYYGSAHPAPASAQNLWSLAGYAGVWHLTDGHDSTTNGLDGTLVAGISAAADAKLGGALDFADAKMSVGTTPNGDLASGFSLETWCHPRRLTDKNGKTNGGNALFGKNVAMSVRVQGSGIQLTTPSVLDHTGANCAIAANQWFHLGLTFRPNTATSGKTTVPDQYKVYRDGVQKASLGASRIPNLVNSSEMWLGGNQWSEQDFDGILDEFRLSYSIRSADWIKAAFDTAAAPASFVTLGPAEPTDQSAPSFGAVAVTSTNGSFAVTVVVDRNVPASIVCTIDGTDYAMATTDAALPATYSAVVSGLAAGTHAATVRATSASGTVVSVPCPDAFHSGALAVTVLSDADEGTLAPGVFRVSRADADPTGLPALTFDVAFSGDGLAAVVAPGVSTLTIPAGAASVDLSVAPFFTAGVDQDAGLVLTVSGATVGASSSATMTVRNSPSNPNVRYVATTGDDDADGLTVASAKATLGAALATLKALPDIGAPRTVYVCDGDYAFDSGEEIAVTVDFPVRVTSLSGDASKVRVTRAGTSKRIFQLDCADAVVSHLTLHGGNALEGGAAFIASNGGTLSDCVVSNCANGTWNSSAAVSVSAGRVARCLFTKNDYRHDGSALYAKGGVVESCLFTGNMCGGAGAVCLGGSAALVNCTIVANTGSTCSGVKMNTSKVRAVNCAIFGNTAPDTATGKVFDDNGTCFVNCAADLEIPGGTGCLCVEPAFRDAAGGDWRLSPASPLIDAGTAPAAYGAASETDLDGASRVVPAAVDVGCYENPKSDVECGFVFSCPVRLVPAEVAFAGAAFGFAGTPAFAWEVANDATGETEHLSGATPVWTTTVPGVYTVRLTVAGNAGTATYERASCLALAPPDMYTSPGNAAAAYPYATPETAAPDVATAVAAAADGTTIHVLRGADGVYPQSATIVVEKGVRIVGETGDPDDVVCTNLVADTSGRGIFLLNHPDAFVSGLTLANGSLRANYAYGGTLRIKPGGGTVSNCVIRSGQSQHFDSFGAGAYVQAGIVTHTRFTGRFTSCPPYNANPSSAGVVAHLTGGRLENCLFHDIEIAPGIDGTSCGPVVAVAGGAMVNCTVVGPCRCAGTGNSDNANFLKYDGGAGIYCGGSGQVANCVSAGVTNADGVATPFSGNAARFANCAGDGGSVWGGTDCVDGTLAAFFPHAGDAVVLVRKYRPASGGPLCDKGADYEPLAAFDLTGVQPRRIGKRVDIGCYEANAALTLFILR